MQVAALPAHQRPPMRMLGRSSEAADHPFKDHPFRAMPSDEVVRPMREMARRTEAAERPFRRLPADDGAPARSLKAPVPAGRYPGDGSHPDEHMRHGSNAPHSAPPGVAASLKASRSIPMLPRSAPAADAQPIVMVHKTGSRVEVAAASAAARALGIAQGMALTQARASVPRIVVRDADPAGDALHLQALAMLLARRWTPTVAISGSDGLLLDLTGVAHLHGGEVRFARRLVRLLERAGFAARVAIADTAGAAWALARAAEGAVALCPPGGHRAALVPLPVALLRIDDAPVALLHRLGVESIGALAALPRAPTARRFGAATMLRLDQALGAAPEPLAPVIPPQDVTVTQRFAEPIATPEALAHWIAALVPRLTGELAAAGLGARRLLLAADRVDNVAQVMRIGLSRPNRDPAHILRLIVRRIEEIEPGYGIDALHLHVRRADPLGPQPFDRDLEDAAPGLGELIDTIANRGARSWRYRAVESDVPERSVGTVPALDPPARGGLALKRDDVRTLDRRAADHPWHPRWPRPARLLARPEPVDGVLAELPDQPPRRFTWRGTSHTIVRADGPERIAGEWWKHSTERGAVRDYFQVEDEHGRRFWLFRRGDGERAETGDQRWYIHGCFG